MLFFETVMWDVLITLPYIKKFPKSIMIIGDQFFNVSHKGLQKSINTYI